MSNITFYYAKGTCSLAPHAIINHLNIKNVKAVSVDLITHKTEDGQDFYKINPKGNVPTLITDDGLKINEGSSVVQYLADHNNGADLLGSVGENRRYKVLNALSFLSSDLHKSFGVLFNSKVKNDFAVDVAIPNIKSKLTYLENILKNDEYIVDNQLSVADFYLFGLLVIIKNFLEKRLESLGIVITDYPNITSLYKKLTQLPAIQKTLESEGLSRLI